MENNPTCKIIKFFRKTDFAVRVGNFSDGTIQQHLYEDYYIMKASLWNWETKIET